MDVWGTVPQWLTAGIAAFALIAAFLSIRSQREIARKRAAMDFFFKVEMDKTLLDAHKEFEKGTRSLKKHLDDGHSLAAFDGNSDYKSIRNYLNLHELMAVGIKQGVLDDHVCYFYWSGELYRAHNSCKSLIDYIQKKPGERNTYIQLISVSERWVKRREKEHE
jgi:hypothetical protein